MRRANQASALQKSDGLPILTQAGISFEISNHFDAIIGISNIKTGDCLQHNLIRAGLSALRPIDLPIVVKDVKNGIKLLIVILLMHLQQLKHIFKLDIRDAYQLNTFQKFSAVLFQAVEENIKGFDAELIANAPDITPDDAEIFKQIFTRSFNDNMIL
ncbi:12743_t:CDS:2 [Funneliformis geosporum]|uniref:12743_t:CDS:1 n=1 Tax=Funneliformis geosporum TaxID=1117311 RepID=A0A9W4SMP6_9GLOM|nr:12743_t:CDS:2 [Funneliformis geosporum]